MTTNLIDRIRSDSTDTVEISLKSMVDILSDASAVISSGGRVRYANTRMGELAGSVIGKRCYESLAGLDLPCPFCPFEKLMAGYAESVINQIHVRHGRTLNVNVSLLTHAGKEPMVLETIREMTSKGERVRTDLSRMIGALAGISSEALTLEHDEARFERIIAHLKSGLSSPKNARVWIDFAGQVFGDKASDIQGSRVQVAVEVEGRPIGLLHVFRDGPEEFDRDDLLFIHLVADLVARVLETADRVERLHGSQENYRKLAANLSKEMWTRTEALAHETSYLQGILRCSEDMIITTDLDSRIVEFNPGAEKIVGYTAEEVLGQHAGDLWENPEERETIMQEVHTEGSIRNYETRLTTKSGQGVEISLTLSILTSEDGRVLGTVGVSKDITKEKAIKRELEQLNSNYRETINFISHESKNSLIVISGFVHRLLNSETDPKRKASLEIVYHHAKFLEAMSRDFLVMADLERGEFKVTKELIENLQEEVILPAMTGLQERYPDSFSKYDTSMGGVGAIKMYGNPQLLEIVFRNLFGNALKYRSPDGKIAYGVEDLGRQYKFNVWNSGPGVPLNKVESIFEKFYRIHDETTRGKKGTGLGLYNIKRIIEAHGGKIWCDTKPGDWIDFQFVLPKE